MHSHLSRRGGIWWARLVVPKHLRQLAGRREFAQSCRTHELHIAKLVSAVLLADWRRKILALEGHPMSSDILKLIGPATALAAGSHLPLSSAVDSSGIPLRQLLSIAAGGKLPLHCRLSQVPGYVVSVEDLEFENPAQGAVGGYVLPSPKQMPDTALQVTQGGVLAIPRKSGAAFANSILADDPTLVEPIAAWRQCQINKQGQRLRLRWPSFGHRCLYLPNEGQNLSRVISWSELTAVMNLKTRHQLVTGNSLCVIADAVSEKVAP